MDRNIVNETGKLALETPFYTILEQKSSLKRSFFLTDGSNYLNLGFSILGRLGCSIPGLSVRMSIRVKFGFLLWNKYA